MVHFDAAALDTGAVDAIAARFAARGGQPGLAYGVVAGGRLVHSGGAGERWTGGPAPDAGTVFRIASMTKSFTAAMIMLLRDRGELRLDDAAQDYVPELSGLVLPAPDCPVITIRHLLTMTAGFPTDDPWGDRQQGLDPAEFARLLAGGDVRPAWAPGTVFDYSNLGYAILGRVIAAVTGEDYARAVRSGVLGPLGLTGTGYEVSEVDPAQLARGYRRDGGTWLELEPDGYGAFAPMGGIFSCVRDLGRWVAGFADAFPARPDGEADLVHPLSRASRREMQLAQVAITAGGDGTVVTATGPLSISYGFGLFAEDDAAYGTIVQHSGGYPGYGSQMRWHPATGIGTIVLANSTYAAAGALAGELLAELLKARPAQAGSAQAGSAQAGSAASWVRDRRAGRLPDARAGASSRRPVARDPGCPRGRRCASAALGPRGCGRALHPERRPGPPAGRARSGPHPAPGADRAVQSRCRPAAGMRLARALPLVADRRARHRGRADQAGAAAAAAGAAADRAAAAGARVRPGRRA